MKLRTTVLIALSLSLEACHRESPPPPQATPVVAAPAKTAPVVAAPAAPAAPKAAAPAQLSERGAMLYKGMCAVCHGADGEGYKADRAPALHRGDFLSAVSDDFLRRAITHGRKGSTMSAWSVEHGGPFSREDIDAVIAFLRTWYDAPNPTLDNGPLTGDAAHGGQLYQRECARCHGAGGVAGQYVQIGNPQLLVAASDGMLRDAIRNGRPGTPMPAFGKTLGDRGVEDVLAHLRALGMQVVPSAAARHEAPPPIPLGKLPLNPRGPKPVGFIAFPKTTPADVVHRELARKARMVLLDARASSDYLEEHIAGASSVPFYDPSPYFDGLPKNAWLVCYCSCPYAESSALAQKLVTHGFKNVTVLAEGLPYWKSKNYGVRSGKKP